MPGLESACVIEPLALCNLTHAKVHNTLIRAAGLDELGPWEIESRYGADSILGTIPASWTADAGCIGIKEIDTQCAIIANVRTFIPIRFSTLVKLWNDLRIIDEFTVIVPALEVIILRLDHQVVPGKSIKVEVAGIGFPISIGDGDDGMIVYPGCQAA